MTQKYVQGLTLIEIMIVIAVIGLLATMVIPKMDYIKRAKVAEALAALSAAKATITEAAMMLGQMPAADAVSVAATSTYVQHVVYTPVSATRGVVTAATVGIADDAINTHLSLIGSLVGGTIHWVCETGDSTGKNGLAPSYVPANCR